MEERNSLFVISAIYYQSSVSQSVSSENQISTIRMTDDDENNKHDRQRWSEDEKWKKQKKQLYLEPPFFRIVGLQFKQ